MDTSERGMGTVLSQEYNGRVGYPIAFFSTKEDLGQDQSLTPSLGPRYFYCNAYRNIATQCSEKKAVVQNIMDSEELTTVRGTINNLYVKRIVVDTGASKTMVNTKWVRDDTLYGRDKSFWTYKGPVSK